MEWSRGVEGRLIGDGRLSSPPTSAAARKVTLPDSRSMDRRRTLAEASPASPIYAFRRLRDSRPYDNELRRWMSFELGFIAEMPRPSFIRARAAWHADAP